MCEELYFLRTVLSWVNIFILINHNVWELNLQIEIVPDYAEEYVTNEKTDMFSQIIT